MGQLEFLGETVPNWKITHQFLQVLNSKWDAISLALQAQNDTKSITLEDLVARLQSNAGIQFKKLERRETERNYTLDQKIEKAFDFFQTEDGDYHGDEEISLIAKAFKKVRSASRDMQRSTKGELFLDLDLLD